jgi:hypothetical protein
MTYGVLARACLRAGPGGCRYGPENASYGTGIAVVIVDCLNDLLAIARHTLLQYINNRERRADSP